MPPAGKPTHPYAAANRKPATAGPVVNPAKASSFQTLTPIQTATGPGGRTTREKHSWLYDQDGRRVLIDHPLGPDADGRPVTPGSLEAAGYDPTPSWRRQGDYWAATLYEKVDDTQSLIVVSTPCSDHFLVARGFPAALDALGKLIEIVGEKSGRVGPIAALKPKSRKK